MNTQFSDTAERLSHKIERLRTHIKGQNHRDYSARKALEKAVNRRAKMIREQQETKGGAP